jgi:hypothetical protein
MNQTLEDMLRIYVMDQQKCWEEFFPLVEFAYNNSYQSTIKMTLFKFLYGRPCRMPLSWEWLEDKSQGGTESDPRIGRLNANFKTNDQGSAGSTEELW